jgi:hypothetical protein
MIGDCGMNHQSRLGGMQTHASLFWPVLECLNNSVAATGSAQ